MRSLTVPNPHPPTGATACHGGVPAPSQLPGGRPITSRHGRDREAGDDGHDRLALPAPRLRLPLLRDLRRPRLDVRLRPLRRPAEEQRSARSGCGRWCRSATTSSRSTPRSSSTRRSGRRRATSPASPTRSSTAARASSASAPTSSSERSCGRKPSKRPGETPDCDLTEARAVQPDVRDARRRARGRELDAPTSGPRRRRASSSTSRTSPSSLRAQAAVRHRAGRQVFRNEITPGNFLFRVREFEQMEMEFFVPPAEAAQVVRVLDRAARSAGTASLGLRDEQPARARARRRGALALLERARATSSTSTRSAGRSSRASRTAATSTSRSTREHSGHEARVDRPRRHALHAARDRAGRRASSASSSRSSATPTTRRSSASASATVLRLHPQVAPVKAAILPLIPRDEGMVDPRARALRGAAPPPRRRARRGRPDRQALPPPGRNRDAVGVHRRRTDARGRDRHRAGPGLARAGAAADRRRARVAGRRARSGTGRSPRSD